MVFTFQLPFNLLNQLLGFAEVAFCINFPHRLPTIRLLSEWYVCMYVCMCACMYCVCMYVYIYMYILT